MNDMTSWGMTGRFEALAAEWDGLLAGRVTAQEKGAYRVVFSGGESAAAVSGKFRYEAATASDYPAVGDFVMLMADASGGPALIQAVLPRKSAFIRKAAGTANSEQVVAANVDTAFICMSLNNDFNLRRVERYLSIAWDSGAVPVIVLTKSDLCEDVPAVLSAVERVAPGADVLVTAGRDEGGYDAILPYIIPKRTVAFIGSSGVGKSTLINRLLGRDALATNGLRNDDRGRHTTTHRELIMLPNGGMVVDTPGMRELGMWDSAEGLGRAFAEIEELARSCRFADCTHSGEPGCAVQGAIEQGELTLERWQSYQKLKAENSYAENSESYLAAKEQKFKNISKYLKANKKR